MRVLIVKFAALGDLVYALPIARYLKQSCPGIQVDWAVDAGLSSVLAGHEHIDRLFGVRAQRIYHGGRLAQVAEMLRLRTAVGLGYDKVVILHRDPQYSRAFSLLGFGSCIQLAREVDRGQKSVQCVPVQPMTVHESLAIREVARATAVALTGQAVETDAPDAVSDDDWSWNWNHLLDAARPSAEGTLITLHIGGGSNVGSDFLLKKWPWFPELAEQLLARPDARLQVVGSPGERDEAETLIDHLRQRGTAQGRVENLAGRTSLPELFQAIAASDAFVGVDSGPLHIADSMGIPSIGLFGPTSTVSWGVLGDRSRTLSNPVACSPCYQDDGVFPECHNGHACMKGLAVESVLEALTELGVWR